jgi:hypothetical protein
VILGECSVGGPLRQSPRQSGLQREGASSPPTTVAVAAAAEEQNQHDDNKQYRHVSLIPFQPGTIRPAHWGSTDYDRSTLAEQAGHQGDV